MNLEMTPPFEADQHSRQQPSVSAADPISRARKAAELVWDNKPVPKDLEPANAEEAQAAVQHLSDLFAEVPGAFREAMDASRSSGTLIASDRLQGLAEIVQNADDVKASELRIQLRSDDLLAAHNGDPVHLSDVLALAMPWLTGKESDSESIGRFGIGLSTLQSLSKTFEVHCEPYHVEIGNPNLAPIASADLPPAFSQPGSTTLRIPLGDGTLQESDLDEWLSRWDDSALLFLRHLNRVILLDSSGNTIHRIELSRHQAEVSLTGSASLTMARGSAKASDGRSWAVYSCDLPTPEGVKRVRKAKDITTPVALAFPLDAAVTGHEETTQQSEPDIAADNTSAVQKGSSKTGWLYAGLPVVQTRLPFFANAQFDTLTSREGLAKTPWNTELVKLLVEVWSEALLDLFEHDPQTAWQAVPLPQSAENETASSSGIIDALESAVIEQARQEVASRLTFPLAGQERVALSKFAVEVEPLEGLLDETEIAQLAELNATLPLNVRDSAGRWRLVLDDWRSHGAELPEPVSVYKALDLLRDEGRSVNSSIALVAVALQEDLDKELRDLPCVITRDGRRISPPAAKSPTVLTTKTVPLADQLGIAILLHPAHLAETTSAPEVLKWLRECGALLKGSNEEAVVRRLAEAGQSNKCIEEPLSDEQVSALRDAFELLPRKDQDNLGPQVGHAIRLESYTYDASGDKKTDSARPSDAYLPAAIISDKQSFAVAADKSEGPVWLSKHYARALRLPQGSEGIGARKFLGLLGAETAPRLQPHPAARKRFDNDSRLGLSKAVGTRLKTRRKAMSKLGATHTLDDHDSPDLHAVIKDIANERKPKQRRIRADSLLGTLARAWDRSFSDLAEVVAANDRYRKWRERGRMNAFWLAQAKEVAWLDDENDTPRKPAELKIRTPGNEAIYDTDSLYYLHKDLIQTSQPGRRALLAALGVSINPSRSELVKRLQELRSVTCTQEMANGNHQIETDLVYRALAQSLSGHKDSSDLTANQLRNEFEQHQLLCTKQGWLSPQEVFGGKPIFGDLRPFTPAIKDCEPLWDALQLRTPSPSDCVKVLQEVAKGRKHDPEAAERAIILETFLKLAEHWENGDTSEKSKLGKLALWTTKGWKRQRPVYATDDRALTKGLGDRLAIWCPGGDLEQFRVLLKPLRIDEHLADNAHVIYPNLAEKDDNLTKVFQQAVGLFRKELMARDNSVAKKLKPKWDRLATYSVKVHSSLELKVEIATDQSYSCKVDARVDIDTDTIYVKDPDFLGRIEKGGRALVALFEGNPGQLAKDWVAAYQDAQDGIIKPDFELAEEREARERAANEDCLKTFQRHTSERHNSSKGQASRSIDTAHRSDTSTNVRALPRQPHRSVAPRVLHDPQSLKLDDPVGHLNKTRSPASGVSKRVNAFNTPRSKSIAPQSRTPPSSYNDIERENVGLELLRQVLGCDKEEIIDLRTQRGVGADAVDELGRFYELKVHAGNEPDQVTLTNSEVNRALSESHFFLAVVSNVEKMATRSQPSD